MGSSSRKECKICNHAICIGNSTVREKLIIPRVFDESNSGIFHFYQIQVVLFIKSSKSFLLCQIKPARARLKKHLNGFLLALRVQNL